MFAIFLLSFTGIPLTAGFFGKFYIFKAALDSNLIWLAVLGMLNSAVAAYYYLRLIVVMYMQPPADGAEELLAPTIGIRVTMLVTAALTIAFGIFPSFILDLAGKSAAFVR
jgi:NADH-quinone oxidoreductase subunit N